MAHFIVDILSHGVKIKAKKGQFLHEIIREAGIRMASPCGGKGKCGKCRIIIRKDSGGGKRPNDEEKYNIHDEDLSKGVRLACQTDVNGHIRLSIPDDSVVSSIRSNVLGPERRVKPLPAVKKIYSELLKASLQDLNPDTERLMESLRSEGIWPKTISSAVLVQLPDAIRRADWKVTTTVWDKREIIDVEASRTCDDCYGVAIDLGTTQIGCYLVNLISGATIDISSCENPQIPYGDDVLSRIEYARTGKKARNVLQKEIVGTINQLISKSCSKHSIDPHHIYEATLVGNTAMHHLALGISPEYLSESPYVPAVKGPLNIKANALMFHIHPEGNIHFMPLIGGFIGSDCLGDILATGIHKEKEICLLLDIGTNTEVVLGNRDRMVTCSCASGPAFEGAHIKNGMKATDGAIESVRIDPKSKQIYTQTINGSPPAGLCGSGIIETISEMLKAGIINNMGLFVKDSAFRNVRMNEEGEWEIMIVNRGNSLKDITVTQRDVNEIQLAKAAIFSGISILMKELGVTPDKIRRVYLAGAFGNTINPANAKSIGLVHDIPTERMYHVGNAALSGAKMVLISQKARKTCMKILERMHYVELAAYPDFDSVYIPALCFPKYYPYSYMQLKG